jgi:hypothetical protein
VFITWCQAIVTLKELKDLTQEERKKLIGDIDPHAVVQRHETWSQVNSEEPVLVGSKKFDASDELSIAQKQNLDPSYRCMLHPRHAAVRALKDLWIAHGIMW